MAKWRDIIESNEYQSLHPIQKGLKKREFWDKTVENSNTYKDMSSDKKKSVRENFFVQRESEGITTAQIVKDAFKNPQANTAIIEGVKKWGKGIDWLAEKIEPNQEELAGKTGIGLTVPFAKQMMAEATRFYKPEYVLTAPLVAKAVGKIASPVGKALWKRVPKKVQKFLTKELTVGKGTPKAYQALSEKATLDRAAGGREAEGVAQILTKEPFTGRTLTGKEQRTVGRIFRGEAETIRQLPKYQEYSAIANQGRKVMDKWSSELVKSGIPKQAAEEAIDANMGKYMARMYKSKVAKGGNFFTKKNIRLRLDGMKKKQQLSAEVLRKMGEIKEPAFPTAVRTKQISDTVTNAKLFKQVSSNPEWVANANLTGDMIKMPNSPNMGALRNKWVVPEIGKDINSIVEAKAFAIPVYSKALSAWKYGKVVLNPATHVRNMMSNSMLLDLSGVNHLRQAQLMPGVMKDYLSKGKMYRLALKHGAVGGEFVGGDVAKIRASYLSGKGGNLNKWLNVLKAPFKQAGTVYQAEEQISKLVKFTDMMGKGATPEVAAKEAQKWLFDYSKIPNIIEGAKQISPFITFTYKSIPRLAEAITNNPMRVYKYYALFKGWNKAAEKTLGMTEAEFNKEKKALPPWYFQSLGGMPMTLMMPWKDKNNDTQWYNLEYTLPIGMAPEIMREGLVKGMVSNPFITIPGALKSNKDFKGSDIVPVGAGKYEKMQKAMEYTYRQIAPSLAPGIPKITKGGYSFEKIMDSLMKRPDYAGRVRDLPTTLLDTLAGIKISPLNVKQSNMFKMKKLSFNIRSIQRQMVKTQTHKGVSDEEKTKNRIDTKRKIENLMKEFKE